MKKIILLMLLLLAGCTEDPRVVATFEPPLQTMPSYSHCYIDIGKIHFVDELLTDNCYAFVNKKNKFTETYEEHVLEKTIKYMENQQEPPEVQFEKENNKKCDAVSLTGGNYLCLKDLSQCMLIEENKICHMINRSD